ncbi:hypothetical protein GV792_04825 [Nocardia cyriacigeorgica]|uniref:hypothetical protein n=1 Tax=Nocardia cyriacigeorgica TaxID=135487 RepID=UPI0013BE58BE|nr:hypothetical protein [Nocardia cyriacigeorgica]NEW49367.1 hypothetical protein [Nocardia cyriacigeorgica]
MSQDPNHVDPLPADGAPHAYVAVWRLHSPHADRPEWDERNALVVPEWDRERIDRLLAVGYDLIPIGPDDEAGTRALDPATVAQLADEQALTDDQATALAKVIAERDEALGKYAVAVADAGWRPPAPEITTLAQMDALPYAAVIRWRAAVYQHCGYGQWLMPGGHPRVHSAWLLQRAAESGTALVVLYVPTEEQSDGE